MFEEAVELAAQLAEVMEGFRSRPYLCPAGVPTIGFGFTRYLNGISVTLLDPPMDREEARITLRALIRRKYARETMLLSGVSLDTARRLAAITDFVFNLGSGAYRVSTLRKKILAGDWDAVPYQLRKWVNGGGKKLPGLVKRREAEITLLS